MGCYRIYDEEDVKHKRPLLYIPSGEWQYRVGDLIDDKYIVRSIQPSHITTIYDVEVSILETTYFPVFSAVMIVIMLGMMLVLAAIYG